MIPRPARDVVKGLSRMKREFHVRFLGGWATAMSPGYPTGEGGNLLMVDIADIQNN